MGALNTVDKLNTTCCKQDPSMLGAEVDVPKLSSAMHLAASKTLTEPIFKSFHGLRVRGVGLLELDKYVLDSGCPWYLWLGTRMVDPASGTTVVAGRGSFLNPAFPRPLPPAALGGHRSASEETARGRLCSPMHVGQASITDP